MRSVHVIAAVCLLLAAKPSFAQKEWADYRNLDDHFAINAPGDPTVGTTTWKSEYDSMFPEKVYRWQDGANKYSVSVVDYSNSEATFYANHHSDDFQAAAYWQIDILGSIQYAATQYRMKPGVKVTFDAFHYINLVTGHQLALTNPDGTKTWVAIYLHENRLYILDATVTKTSPPPIIFQQSLEFLDSDGKSIRYRTYYFDKLPEQKIGRRGASGDPGAPGGPNANAPRGGGQGGGAAQGAGQPAGAPAGGGAPPQGGTPAGGGGQVPQRPQP
jgi:hypothetical protein